MSDMDIDSDSAHNAANAAKAVADVAPISAPASTTKLTTAQRAVLRRTYLGLYPTLMLLERMLPVVC